MIPCPHCDREFDKRAGLMRHIQGKHPEAFGSPADLAREVLEADSDYDPLSDAIPDPAEVRREAEEYARARELAAATSGPVSQPAAHFTAPVPPIPELPLHLRQVAFRVGNGYESDQMDVRYLLRLAQIGHELVAQVRVLTEELRHTDSLVEQEFRGSEPWTPPAALAATPDLLARWDSAVR